MTHRIKFVEPVDIIPASGIVKVPPVVVQARLDGQVQAPEGIHGIAELA